MDIREKQPTVYTAQSKHYAFAKMHICKFVLEQGYVPLNPFNLWGYFLYDLVDRNAIRRANNTIVQIVDEVWVFGPIANGVWAEIELAIDAKKPMRFFSADATKELEIAELQFEDELAETVAASEMRAKIDQYVKKV